MGHWYQDITSSLIIPGRQGNQEIVSKGKKVLWKGTKRIRGGFTWFLSPFLHRDDLHDCSCSRIQFTEHKIQSRGFFRGQKGLEKYIFQNIWKPENITSCLPTSEASCLQGSCLWKYHLHCNGKLGAVICTAKLSSCSLTFEFISFCSVHFWFLIYLPNLTLVSGHFFLIWLTFMCWSQISFSYWLGIWKMKYLWMLFPLTSDHFGNNKVRVGYRHR